MKLQTKDQLVRDLRTLFNSGWKSSIKKTVDTRNDGAVGNTLESLLGIDENNLPIPNAAEWELKGQRAHTGSLITLKHIEPSPRAAKIVPNLLLPSYGWPHKAAGIKYPRNEMSFRSTTSATEYTSRGFKIEVDRISNKLRLNFDPNKANIKDAKIARWLETVDKRIGLGSLDPEPYWGFEDLRYEIGSKIKNCLYVIAESKIIDSKEYFLYKDLYILTGFSFERFLNCIDSGALLIDFDARTGHNHGTKFRLRQGYWRDLYLNVEKSI